jgi:alpha-galactosidase
MIVLDDGWFGLRDDDSTSLGDWYPNLRKFPQGLRALVEDVNAAGCKFGLWFEPEMVSEASVRCSCIIIF